MTQMYFSKPFVFDILREVLANVIRQEKKY